jgi:long-chain acyl-CoA synthetase
VTIPQALSEAARRYPDRPALLGPQVALTHAELERCIGRAAADLEARGVRPGDVVGVSMETSPLQLVTILAIAHAGACSVHVSSAHPRAVKEALVAQFSVAAVVGDPGTPGIQHADSAWLDPARGASHADRSVSAAPWRLPLSSGTTGLQKAIQVTHQMAVTELTSGVVGKPNASDDRFLCQGGLDSNWGLVTALMHLVAGGTVVFPQSRRLAHYLEAVSRHSITQLIMSPALLREVVEALPAGAGGLPTVRQIMVGGSSPPPQLIAAALERVSPHVVTGYGATELGLVSLAGGEMMLRAPLSAGRLQPGFDAEAVDESGTRLASGATGLLRFRRKGMAREYFRNAEATARFFRDGWFLPGDQGRVDAEGLLFIEGRVDDKLNIDGRKVEPTPIEQALEEHPAVAEAAAFAAAPGGGPARLYAAVVLRAPADEKALIGHCRSRVGAGFTPTRVFIVKKLPRNEAGKLLRAELARRVRRPGR